MLVKFEHGSAEWHAHRARHVGGSECSALFGVQPAYAMGLFALWHVKAGKIQPPVVDGPRPRWGLLLEEAIAQAVREERGWTVTKGGYVMDETTPGMGCTLDYVGECDELDGPGCLEFKNTDWIVHKKSWTNDEPPLHVLIQLMHQLGCTGYKWGAVVALVGGNDLRIYRYAARPGLIADIRKRVTAFWRSIDEGKPPAIDGSDSAFHALRELHPEIVDDAIDLTGDNEFPNLCAELDAARTARMEAEKHEDHLKAQVMEKLGDHKRGWTDGWSASITVVAANPGKVITPEMCGEVIGARKESRRLNVKERAEA
jgi:predicted phage-related endonuclease